MILIPETGTSTVKTMTVLQSAKPLIDIGERVSTTDVDLVGSVRNGGESDVNAYRDEKFKSFGL